MGNDLRSILKEEFSEEDIEFIIENDLIGELVTDDIVQVVSAHLETIGMDLEQIRKIVSKYVEEGFTPSEIISLITEGSCDCNTMKNKSKKKRFR